MWGKKNTHLVSELLRVEEKESPPPVIFGGRKDSRVKPGNLFPSKSRYLQVVSNKSFKNAQRPQKTQMKLRNCTDLQTWVI